MTREPDFDGIARRMRRCLRRTAILRPAVRLLKAIVYSAALLWFVYCFCLACGLMVTDSQEQSVDSSLYLIAAFLLSRILQYAMVKGLLSLKKTDDETMSAIIGSLFADAVYSADRGFNRDLLADSRLFDTKRAYETEAGFTCYGRLDFDDADGRHAIADVGVTTDRAAAMYDTPGVNVLAVIWRAVARPLAGARVDSAMHSFRGMFGYVPSARRCSGRVLVLPDRIEAGLGYLARSVQSMADKDGARLVTLEDPGFERLFAVYADDEVEARKVLTPAMMRRLSRLRRDFGRELMLSFVGDRLYFAAETPGGFLRPVRGRLVDAALLRQIYNEVNTIRSIKNIT